MPGKSKHGKGKYTTPTKKRKKERTVRPAIVAEQPVEITPQVQKVSPVVSDSSKNIPEKVASPEPVKHPYIGRELVTISVLAGILFIILIVLALVLP